MELPFHVHVEFLLPQSPLLVIHLQLFSVVVEEVLPLTARILHDLLLLPLEILDLVQVQILVLNELAFLQLLLNPIFFKGPLSSAD